MEIIIGLIIIAIGSFCQSSSYVPIKKVKEWSWESFWLLQGVFAWLVFPLLGALLGIPQGSSLFDLWGTGGAPMSIFYGILWGVGGLTFGLSMRYLGVALGQSITGVDGFEPTHEGVKVPCLTAWLYPKNIGE